MMSLSLLWSTVCFCGKSVWDVAPVNGAHVLQTELCCGQKGLLFRPGPPFLSCQLKSHRPLQMMCQILENPCPASSTD